MEIDSFVYCHC